MPGASPTNDLAAGLEPTAEGNAGLTLTHFMVGQSESSVEPEPPSHAPKAAGLGGLWVEFSPGCGGSRTARMDQRKVTVAHDDDLHLVFDASQDARHGAMLRLNEMARAMVERAKAKAVGQQPDEDGVVPGPGRLRLVLGFDREDKSAKQRKFLHGPVLGQIAEQVRLPDGSRYTAEAWKHYFRRLYVPDRWESYRLPGAKRATPHRVRVSTESLSVRQYSALIDAVIAHATSELGVVFDLDPVERESARYVRPRREAKRPAPQNEEVAA